MFSTSSAIVHSGYCLKHRIPELLMTKRSMKLILQLFLLSSEFRANSLAKKVNKKIQEIKHKFGNLPRGEEQRGRELAGFIIKYTLCYPTDPRLTYRDWILYRKSIIVTALQLCILMISERSNA